MVGVEPRDSSNSNRSAGAEVLEVRLWCEAFVRLYGLILPTLVYV